MISQLGVIGLRGSITMSSSQLNENRIQYMDLTINKKPTCVVVDTKETHKFVIENTKKILELKIKPINSCIKTVNTKPQNAHGVGVNQKAEKV